MENCDPFGCKTQTKVDTEAMAKLRGRGPDGPIRRAWDNYTNRNHLALDELAQIWAEGSAISLSKVMNLPFYKALAFTLTYCFLVTPLAMASGLLHRLGRQYPAVLGQGPGHLFLDPADDHHAPWSDR